MSYLFSFLVIVLVAKTLADDVLYVCQSAEPAFLGKYTASTETKNDGAPVYSNDKDMSFFRNNKFWSVRYRILDSIFRN
jgi:hypothetical protein